MNMEGWFDYLNFDFEVGEPMFFIAKPGVKEHHKYSIMGVMFIGGAWPSNWPQHHVYNCAV